MKPEHKRKIWMAIGVAILIALLLIWLEFAFLTGDTDVSAQIFAPQNVAKLGMRV